MAGGVGFDARTFTQIAGGERANCAVDDLQHVWCWGDNSVSQLGIGFDGGTAPAPTRVAGVDLMPLDDAVAELVYGRIHGCIRLVGGDVRCWGRNDRGQAGIDAPGEADRAWPVGVSGIVDIAAGDDHICAVNAAGAMWCWGINDNGQFGNGTTTASNAPTGVSVGVVTNLSAGLQHTCATIDGQPRCWGRGDDGELGTGELTDAPVPIAPLDVSAAATLIAVHNYSCAIDEGRLSCWGSNHHGQLGREATIIRTTPTPVVGLTETTSISNEGLRSCGVSGGDAYCWGLDPGSPPFGRLGGAPVGATPTRVLSGSAIHAVIDGTALLQGVASVGFGFNSGARIQAAGDRLLTPTPMTFVGDIDQIGMGTAFSCALQGTVVNCRGLNSDGQLGRGTGSGVEAGPAQPVPVTAAAQISVGPTYACATQVDGQVVCWGDNQNGQLGNNTMVDSGTPLDIAPLTDAIMVSAGKNHACGIQRRMAGAILGQVWCWGRNVERQTGAMALGQRVEPNMVFALDDAVNVEAYTSHICAIRSGGQVVCWGNNQNYELGDGTTADSTNPVNVVGLSDAATLGTNGLDVRTTCAARVDGTAVCWGGCWDGLCGTGEALARPNSEAVRGLEL